MCAKIQSCSECPEAHFGLEFFEIWEKNQMANFGNFGGHFSVLNLGLDHGFHIAF